MKHYNRNNFQISQSVGYHLNKARNLLVMELDDALKGLGISAQQMGILLALARGAAATPFELTTLLGIDSGSMTRMLDKLEKKQLLVRRRNQDDRRVINLVLTAQGLAVAEQIPDIAPEVLNARLHAFSKEEFREFLRLLQKFVEA